MQKKLAEFQKTVWTFYASHGRHDLPWRKTRDAYKILVSEIMLQQTQVERVVPFYTEFTKRFPTARTLSAAPLSAVLKCWQGLGYNRRAKMLHSAAKLMTASKPKTVGDLENLPGVGPYTAGAVAAFAWNRDVIFIETNIRTALIHHFFNKSTSIYGSISDAKISGILERLLPKGRSREWYSALMDYGAHLKRSGMSQNARSMHYAKQSRFAGSLREARGAILRELAKGTRTEARLAGLLGDDRTEQLCDALASLRKDGLITKRRASFSLAE